MDVAAVVAAAMVLVAAVVMAMAVAGGGDGGHDGDGGRNATPKLRARSVFRKNQAEIQAIETELSELRARMKETLPSQVEWEEQARARLSQRGQNLQLHPIEVIKVTIMLSFSSTLFLMILYVISY